jgi:DMSO/TMAO reductase YedYZ molybdopterin-dependent catalytic subunit
VSFFERNRRQLAERGYDPARLPPGQYLTERFPVLHVGDIPEYAPGQWDLRIFGLVADPLVLDLAELRALPAVDVVVDIHCVTKWSKFDTHWTGVRVRDLFERVGVDPRATHVLEHAEFGYTTNVPLAAVLGDDALVAYAYDGQDLAPEHGGPVRLVLPQLYFWKSAKWLRGLELRAGDQPGFWEQNGYHRYGDPFLEQRFSAD